MKNRRTLVIGLVLLGILIAAIVLNGVIRETIAPALLAWVWRVSLMSRGFPQVIIWAFFIAIIPIIAVFSLIQTDAKDEPEPEMEQKRYDGRVHEWYRQLVRMPEGDYFRERVNQQLSQLTLDTVAYEERLRRNEAKDKIKNGELEMSDDVRRFLQKGLRTQIRLSTGYGNGQPEQHLEDVEMIVKYLEDELEVVRED